MGAFGHFLSVIFPNNKTTTNSVVVLRIPEDFPFREDPEDELDLAAYPECHMIQT